MANGPLKASLATPICESTHRTSFGVANKNQVARKVPVGSPVSGQPASGPSFLPGDQVAVENVFADGDFEMNVLHSEDGFLAGFFLQKDLSRKG